MRWTELALMPTAFAIMVAVQWVASVMDLGEHHDMLSDIRPKWRDARRPRLIAQQAVVTSLHEAFLPAPHTGFRSARRLPR
jgi:hypothetical protein